MKSPGDAAAVVGNGASGAVIRSQKASVVRSTPGRKLSAPKLTTSGTTVIACAAATSGGRSLAESVTIATWDTVGSSVGPRLEAGSGLRPMIRTAVERRGRRCGRGHGADRLRFAAWRVPSSRSSSARSRCDSRPGSRARCSSTTTPTSRQYGGEPVDAAHGRHPRRPVLRHRALGLAAVRRSCPTASGTGGSCSSGPAFGAVAVIITAFTVSLPVIGFTRLLEGASTAASVPSILGFIAFATAADELLRGKAVARFEAATLAGLMVGFVLAGPLFQAVRPHGVPAQRPRLRRLVPDLPLRRARSTRSRSRPAARTTPRRACGATSRILRGSHVWLLAPTWIAINATLGLYTSQTLFQLVREPNPEFANQQLMGGFDPLQVSARARDRRPAVLRRPVLLGRPVPGRCGGRRSSCTGSSAGR